MSVKVIRNFRNACSLSTLAAFLSTVAMPVHTVRVFADLADLADSFGPDDFTHASTSCTLLPNITRQIGSDFTLARKYKVTGCVGAGTTAEVWSIQSDDDPSSSDLVAKAKYPDYNALEKVGFQVDQAKEAVEACRFGHSMAELDSAHWNNCLVANAHAELGGYSFNYSIQGKATGQEFAKLLEESKGKAPAVVSTLKDVFEMISAILNTITVMMQPAGFYRLHHYHPDPHLGNIVVDEAGNFKFIDYDWNYMCCDKPGLCGNDVVVCDSAKQGGMTARMNHVLFWDLVMLLIERKEPEFSTFISEWPGGKYHQESCSKTEAAALPNATMAAKQLVQFLRPEYTEDWAKLNDLAIDVIESGLLASPCTGDPRRGWEDRAQEALTKLRWSS